MLNIPTSKSTGSKFMNLSHFLGTESSYFPKGWIKLHLYEVKNHSIRMIFSNYTNEKKYFLILIWIPLIVNKVKCISICFLALCIPSLDDLVMSFALPSNPYLIGVVVFSLLIKILTHWHTCHIFSKFLCCLVLYILK